MNSDPNCIFCRIIDRKVPAKIVFEDELSIAFEDLNPQAPVHVLIVPKKHLPDIHTMATSDQGSSSDICSWLPKTSHPKKGSKKAATAWSSTTVLMRVRPYFTFISTCSPDASFRGLRDSRILPTVLCGCSCNRLFITPTGHLSTPLFSCSHIGEQMLFFHSFFSISTALPQFEHIHNAYYYYCYFIIYLFIIDLQNQHWG